MSVDRFFVVLTWLPLSLDKEPELNESVSELVDFFFLAWVVMAVSLEPEDDFELPLEQPATARAAIATRAAAALRARRAR
jgi:hypothetical protein